MVIAWFFLYPGTMDTKMTFQRYLVGGAVRDQLLGIDQKDRDWVVVGADPSDMVSAGYQQVGKDFPVFLHPTTKEEHALARVERKVGAGYRGFETIADRTVSLEDDLLRRDLTINAIAQKEDGTLVDPHGGVADLNARILRHVSPAFSEDPVRVLRIARFMARYSHMGFTIAEETKTLLRQIVAAGEVDHLVPERVWTELSKALVEPTPSAFLATLHECGALARILPEVDALYGVEQAAQWHPEIDTGIHTEMVLDQAAKHWPGDLDTAFACLTHDLGKALTEKAVLPAHHGHEEAGLEPLAALCDRLRVPTRYRRQAAAVCEHHLGAHRVFEMRPGSVLSLLEATSDALRSPQYLETFVRACEADKRGRAGLEDRPYPQADHLRQAFKAAKEVSARPLVEKGLVGEKLGEAIRAARIRQIHLMHSAVRNPPKPAQSRRPSP